MLHDAGDGRGRARIITFLHNLHLPVAHMVVEVWMRLNKLQRPNVPIFLAWFLSLVDECLFSQQLQLDLPLRLENTVTTLRCHKCRLYRSYLQALPQVYGPSTPAPMLSIMIVGYIFTGRLPCPKMVPIQGYYHGATTLAKICVARGIIIYQHK